MNEKIFKAYDIRGTYPNEVNEESFKRIAQSYASFVKPKKVAVGRDVRLSSPSLQQAVIAGLTEMGVDVIDVGMGPTELIYFAVGSLQLDGGIQVSASHNPAEYNGLKLIKSGVEAISGDTGLLDIKKRALSSQVFDMVEKTGKVEEYNVVDEYINYVVKLVDLSGLKPQTLVANNNFGASGPIAKKIIEKIGAPIKWIELNFQPDGHFPKGRPDPLIPENRAETSMEIRRNEATLGVAWDADGDRCYVADENGEFIEGCHLTALLAKHLLVKHPGEKIVYDPRNTWAVEQYVKDSGGVPILSKTGHAFIKNRMKLENALFGGEMSGHYYYRDFYFADNGILTFLYFLELLSQAGSPSVSEIAKPLREKFFVSGEINFKVDNVDAAVRAVKEAFPGGREQHIDGLSVDFNDWRYSLRSSNTEPLLRLNVEALSEAACMRNRNRIVEILEYHLDK